jgi:peptidoglycan/xylan/chitin deacetylase (PgdA/CDA1 family)
MLVPSAIAIDSSIGIAVAAGVAYGGFTYASLWPASTLFGDALTAPARPGELALTFDDGPSRTWTPRLLDALASHNIRATFFLLGSRASAHPELVRRTAAAGHLIGNHSWNHPNLARSSAKTIREQLQRTNDVLQQIVGGPVRFFRPPFGARRPAVFRIARSLGLQPVLWNAMTSDWSQPSAERIAARLTESIGKLHRHGHAVNIVLHDGGHRDPDANREPSITAAAHLVTQFKSSCQFVTLDEWLGESRTNAGK